MINTIRARMEAAKRRRLRSPNFFRVALALGMSLIAVARDRTISERIAHRLVEEALVALGWPSVHADPMKDYWAPEFYSFEAYLSGPVADDGTGVLQSHYLAVNTWTGDVWDTTECRQITSAAIQKEQEFIWKRSRLPIGAREALHDKSPASCSLIELMTRKKKH
jgi:hypothetical protein